MSKDNNSETSRHLLRKAVSKFNMRGATAYNERKPDDEDVSEEIEASAKSSKGEGFKPQSLRAVIEKLRAGARR